MSAMPRETIEVPALATSEWAVQMREFPDGIWDELDNGSRWSHRRGRIYTEAEAREEAGRRINRLDPETWRRVVTRTVTEWAPERTDGLTEPATSTVSIDRTTLLKLVKAGREAIDGDSGDAEFSALFQLVSIFEGLL